jgi:hypothetical protein
VPFVGFPNAAQPIFFPDMGNLEIRIALASRHVDEGRRMVEQQRQLIAKHGPQPDTVALLKTFEQSLEIFQADLERLLEERDRE